MSAWTKEREAEAVARRKRCEGDWFVENASDDLADAIVEIRRLREVETAAQAYVEECRKQEPSSDAILFTWEALLNAVPPSTT